MQGDEARGGQVSEARGTTTASVGGRMEVGPHRRILFQVCRGPAEDWYLSVGRIATDVEDSAQVQYSISLRPMSSRNVLFRPLRIAEDRDDGF